MIDMNNMNQLAEFLRYFIDCHQQEVAPVRLAVFGCRDSLNNCIELDHPIAVSSAQYLSAHLQQNQPNLHMMEDAVEALIKHYRGRSDIEGDLCELLGHLEYGENVQFNPVPFGFDEFVNEIEALHPRPEPLPEVDF